MERRKWKRGRAVSHEDFPAFLPRKLLRDIILWQSRMISIEPKYSTGEIILSGDRIKYEGEMGEVDFTITRESNDWYTYWNELGEGVMLKVPSFGSVYVPFSDEDLEFISRKGDVLSENG